MSDFSPGAVLDFWFTSKVAGVGTTLAGTPVVSIYKDNSTTQTTTGITLSVDNDGLTGYNKVRVDTSADGTFYAAGSSFAIVVTTGTVGGTNIVPHVVDTFTLSRGAAFARIGVAGAGLTALGDTRLANLDASVNSRMATYTQPTGFLAATFPGTVASTTNITAGTLTTVTNLTTLPTAPTDWLTAAAVKADAVTKIQAGLMLSASYTAPLSASGVRDAVGLGSNNLDAQLSGILSAASAPGSTPPTAGEIATQVFSTVLPGSFAAGTAGYTIYNRLTAIKAKTDTITTLDDLLAALSEAHGDGQWDAVGEGGEGGTVDLSAVLAALATAEAALVKIQAAVYDTARTVGRTIILSNGHTQTITRAGRVTA